MKDENGEMIDVGILESEDGSQFVLSLTEILDFFENGIEPKTIPIPIEEYEKEFKINYSKLIPENHG